MTTRNQPVISSRSSAASLSPAAITTSSGPTDASPALERRVQKTHAVTPPERTQQEHGFPAVLHGRWADTDL